MNPEREMLLAILAVTMAVVVAFVTGYLFGETAGGRRARIHAFNQCLDWAALSMQGHPSWRFLSAERALTKAGALIGGNDIVPGPPAHIFERHPAIQKGQSA